jgi:hypothetical protein
MVDYGRLVTELFTPIPRLSITSKLVCSMVNIWIVLPSPGAISSLNGARPARGWAEYCITHLFRHATQ